VSKNVTLMLPTESVIANAFYKIAFIIGWIHKIFHQAANFLILPIPSNYERN
jgi:hypothetical protein